MFTPLWGRRKSLQPQVDNSNSITSPGSAADRGTNDKERAWLELVEAQGDFLFSPPPEGEAYLDTIQGRAQTKGAA